MKMKYILITCLTILLSSCASTVQIIECEPDYGNHPSSLDLSPFRNKADTQIKKIKNQEITDELFKIKNMKGKENLMPSAALYYAFIVNKDTIYANNNLNYWYYNGSVRMYSSPIINKNRI
ncbi:hypothetical protein ABH942_003308 [Flavobacterium sp. 28YEA47A]|uniref:hypothetical protein n=1 Tax=Flavobacterium sp. 28YEA47A TaxID=3156276 RepID=UPI0035185FA2